MEESPVGKHQASGAAESEVKSVQGQLRVFKSGSTRESKAIVKQYLGW